VNFAALLGFCLIIALPLGRRDAASGENVIKKVRVGIYQNEPQVFIDEDGKPVGFWLDILDKIAEAEDWSLEYLPCQWDRCLDAVEEGKLDLMVDVAHSEEHERRFDFNQEVVLASWSVVYSRSGLELGSMLDLDQKRVAVLKDSIQYAALAERTQAFDIKPQFVEVANFKEMFELLDQGKVDAGVADHFLGKEAESQYRVVRSNILVSPARLHFVVAKGKQAHLLAALDRALKEMESDPNSVYYQALERWLEPQKSFFWVIIRRFLIDMVVYVPLIALVVFVLWNRSLTREVKLRQQTEALLRESEQRFRLAIANAPFPIMIHAEDGEVLQINTTWTELTGYTHQDIPTTQAWAQKAYGDRAGIVLKNVIAKKYSLESRWEEGEFTVTTSDGHQRIWLFSSAPLKALPDGRRVVISLATDVTQHMEAETALRESEARYRGIYNQLAVGIVYAGYEGEIIDYNQQFCNMLGYSVEDLGNKTMGEITYPEDRQLHLPMWQQLFDREIEHFSIEKRYVRKNGSIFWANVTVSLLVAEDEKTKHAIAVIQNINDHKEAEIALQESEQRFHNMAANLPGAILKYVLHPDGSDSVIYMSHGCHDLWEVEAKAVVEDAQILWGMIHPDDLPLMYESIMVSAQTLQPWFWQWRIITPSGKMKWLEGAGHPERHDNGNVVWDTLILDVSQRKNAEAALQASEECLRLVTENMRDLVCLHHPDGHYLYVTPSSKTLLGYSPEELIGRHPYELFHPDDGDLIGQEAHQLALSGIASPITYRIRRKTGEYIWLETLTQPILTQDGQVKHLQTTSRDVSDRVKVEEQLKHDALHDGLTGLPNRNLLMERLDLVLKRARSHPEFKFALLFLDLDNFKVVNDSLGHFIGDKLLLAVVKQLISLIRDNDLAVRLGGDEFVILLEEIDEVEVAVRVAERILETLRSPLKIAEREVFISASIGIVVGKSNYHRAEELLRDADLAMYRAKQSGRGRYAIFDPAMHFQMVKRLHLEHDLRKALKNGEFFLYYQPVFSLETGVIKGFEALIRWQHPQRGLVLPGDFIEIAEETGLIVPIGRWILHTACQQLATWQYQFPAQPLRISVNLSVKQLQELLLPQLEEVLTTYNLQGDSLVIEITESMLVQNVEATSDLLNRVKAKGINLSIDDFGTGYSSLSYLHQLPVDTLKIDRSFISPAGLDVRKQVIAKSIIGLSNLLELKAIAEGIETPQQLEWLKKLGCELGQGFLFSPPLPAAQATELLKRKVLFS
jgi:diguanylate cyclase (GGDEF)-like protein/PAS domain S-box-containing protein